MNTSIPGDKPKSHFNLPNTLTWLRILMIPGVVVLYYLPFWWAHPAAGVGFALAGITDTLDGYFARKLGLTSRLGAFFDCERGSALVCRHHGRRDHRPRDCSLRAARMDGGDRCPRPDQGIAVGEVQNDYADNGAVD